VYLSPMLSVRLDLLAPTANRTIHPPAKEPPGPLVPFVAIVAVIARVVAIAAFIRAGRADE
jgi:hypothetical protein